MYSGVASLVLFGQAVRESEPWTVQSRLAGLGLIIIVVALVWWTDRVRRRR